MAINFEWDDGGGESGVHTHEGNLLWWYQPGGPNGRFGSAAREQTFDDYRENGPAVSAPDEIIRQLDAELGRKS